MINIRNFAIIAHVDHGKSTLADRFLEITGVIKKEDHAEQMLDRNPISRERGITIKLAPVRMDYTLNAINYTLNLIDTPGHADFSYEVERTLACVEGVILLVDASAGIQAQTIAHTYKALEQNLVIIPAVNKIDLPQANVSQAKDEIAEFLGINQSQIFEISAKTGEGVEELLKSVVRLVPSPFSTSKVENAVRALIFDSYYDSFRGVIAFVRIFDGEIQRGQKLSLFGSSTEFEVKEVGIFTPDLKPKNDLSTGEVGYIVTNLKDIHHVAVGDTISDLTASIPLPGYKKINPMVFASIFPTDGHDLPKLKNSLEKLSLNDSSLTFTQIYSKALGGGFRVGFLGLLHADIVRERLEREYDLNVILTGASVDFRKNEKGQIEEPAAKVTIVTPAKFTNSLMRLCEEARGIFKNMDNKTHVIIEYEIPLTEIVSDFYDKLKTISSGFGSFDWEFVGYKICDASLLTIILNDEEVDEFSEYVVPDKAYEKAKSIVEKLAKLIPRQQFEVRIQAKYKGKIISSSRISPFRKNVTAKLYGGDRSRKDKLLKKQKKGKKLMKSVGRVEIPKEAFFKLFSG